MAPAAAGRRPARRPASPPAAGTRSPRRARGRRGPRRASTPARVLVGHPVRSGAPARRPSGGSAVDGGVDVRPVGAVGAGEHQGELGVLGVEAGRTPRRGGAGSCGARGCRGRARRAGRRGRERRPGRSGVVDGARGGPWGTTRTRSAPSSSVDLRRRRRPTACAPRAPRSMARRSTGAKDRTVALTSSGGVRNEQSCTVTTLGRPDGGTT